MISQYQRKDQCKILKQKNTEMVKQTDGSYQNITKINYSSLILGINDVRCLCSFLITV